MAPRPLLVGATLVVLLVVLAVPGKGGAPRLRGSVACLDCAAGHGLSGVVVAVRCAGDGGGAGLHAVQTDARGAFDVVMPAVAASASPTPCAARVLGATTEQLCAPRGLAVARVVPAGRAPAASSYALGSRLAFFTTRCRRPTSGGGAAVATTTEAHDQQRQQGDAAPRVPAARPMPPAMPTPPAPVVSTPPRAGGSDSPPIGVGGGLPLIYFFPFIPIIGIP